MKHRIVHTLQKYFLNPPIKLALAMGLPLPGYALLETRGRKTGKPQRTLSRYRQIKISVIGGKSGKTISIPVWFVLEGEKLYAG
jgi:hypothetical protein